MTFLVQTRIWDEYGYDHFIESMERFGEVIMVDIIPFTETVRYTSTQEEVPDDLNPDFVFGSGRLVAIANNKGWNTFENFKPIDLELTGFIDVWFNNGFATTIGKLPDIIRNRTLRHISPNIFLKPYTEKLFTGCVFRCSDLLEKPITELVQCASSPDISHERVLVAKARHFDAEYRFVVIDNKIISGSSYGKNVRYEEVSRESDRELWDGVWGIVQTFTRSITGTVDVVTYMDDHSRVVKLLELNNLNSAGLYKNDVNKILGALTIKDNG